MTLEISTNSPENTRGVAEKLARRLKGGEFIELIGDLGSGKTVFIKGLAAGLGIKEGVSSPTFTISRVYPLEGDRQFHHFDLYRLPEGDIVALELAEALSQAGDIVAAEWAGAATAVLPTDRLRVELKPAGANQRRIVLSGEGQYNDVIGGLKNDLGA